MNSIRSVCRTITAGLVLVASLSAAAAEDVLKLAVPHRGAWESAAPELGQQAGIFRKHGIVLDLQYVDDSTGSESAVVSGVTDIGMGVETLAVLRAYSRGTPIRIIGANLTGEANFWYVLATSPARTMKDLANRTVAYASNGSSSHYDLLDLIKRAEISVRLVATGGAAATLQRLMQSQLDVGWGRPPFGAEEIEQGKIRVVARSNDVPRTRSKTETVLVVTATTLKSRGDAVARFMKAYRETIDWMYAGPDAVEHYAAFAGISRGAAQRVRDDFFTKGMLLPDQIVGLRTILREARTLRYIQFRMSRKEIAELIRTPASDRDALSGSIVAP